VVYRLDIWLGLMKAKERSDKDSAAGCTSWFSLLSATQPGLEEFRIAEFGLRI